jgi:Tfp pilus assembly protein PilE
MSGRAMNRGGFTLIELVVIAIIAILAGPPALSKAMKRAGALPV